MCGHTASCIIVTFFSTSKLNENLSSGRNFLPLIDRWLLYADPYRKDMLVLGCDNLGKVVVTNLSTSL